MGWWMGAGGVGRRQLDAALADKKRLAKQKVARPTVGRCRVQGGECRVKRAGCRVKRAGCKV